MIFYLTIRCISAACGLEPYHSQIAFPTELACKEHGRGLGAAWASFRPVRYVVECRRKEGGES